ncbi:MAG: sugar transferase [Bacteroidota bacterium]|jgi:lipopolysaccharide/colanic/teichoic acid biosynthesis glycosyltransferase
MTKRIFDIISSFFFLVLIFPLFILISILIKIDSKGPIFFKQIRVGKNNKDFLLLKFRTMRVDQKNSSLITVGNDSRITNVGNFLRKYKLDEFPQLINILKGEMSVVGPRPEVRKYVDMYSISQLEILSVKPGLTDPSSIKFSNESELLGTAENPEKYYIETLMPLKILISLKYIRTQSFVGDLRIIFQTFSKIFK